jgi:formiminoglutamase
MPKLNGLLNTNLNALLHATDSKLLFSRADPQDMRLGDFARALPSSQTYFDFKNSIVELSDRATCLVVGYPDDEGIRLNGGRPGSKEAPDRIRNYFYRMTPPAFLPEPKIPFFAIVDAGNLAIGEKGAEKDIETRHEQARAISLEAQARNIRVVSFGGGHDYGFSDAAAYCEAALARKERPLVINFDAHLDVRPTDKGLTSGTPFFRLLSKYPNIDFIELGLQSQCNSKAHVDWLTTRGGLVSFEEERRARGLTLTDTLLELLGDGALSKRSAFLSIDIDGFSSAVAPGASQSWPTGFETDDFFPCFSWCLRRFDVRGVGIYEVSPPLDVDDRTSRLAALIAHRFVFEL